MSLRVLMLAAPAVMALAEGPHLSMEEMLKLHAEMEEATEAEAAPTLTEAEWDVELSRRLGAYSSSYSYAYYNPSSGGGGSGGGSGGDSGATDSPTAYPTMSPTDSPTAYPTMSPTDSPTAYPTMSPTDSPTAYPTMSPTHSMIVCRDSSTWNKSGKYCSWVAKEPESRCSKNGDDGTKAYDACHEACSTGACESTAPTCSDSLTWYKNNQPDKTCDWVAKDITRCAKKGEDKTLASESCPEVCGTCEEAICVDSDLWFKNGDPTKGCKWASKDTISRCAKTNQIGEEAYVGCPYTCGSC